MNSWIVVAALALVSAAFLWRFTRPNLIIVAGILVSIAVGLGGYALQGHPKLASSPTLPREKQYSGDTSFARERSALLENLGDIGGWLSFADAMQRAGMTRQSVEAMTVATRAFPKSPDLWVGLGNALVVHGDGFVSPAARLAFDHAGRLAPDHPGPSYFLGMAWLQAGNPAEAEAEWQALRDRSRDDAPWVADLERKIKAAQAMRAAGVGGQP